MTQLLSAPGPISDPRSAPADTHELQRVVRWHASGVAVITAGAGTPTGFCATSFATLSVEPPLVSFAVGVRSSSWPAISTAESVLAHLLAEDQEELARRFGRSGPGKFEPPTRWDRDESGLPLLLGVLAWLVLAPVVRLPVEDRVLVVCRVVRARVNDNVRGPLISHACRYRSLARRS